MFWQPASASPKIASSAEFRFLAIIAPPCFSDEALPAAVLTSHNIYRHNRRLTKTDAVFAGSTTVRIENLGKRENGEKFDASGGILRNLPDLATSTVIFRRK
jgi:hypothetical protein